MFFRLCLLALLSTPSWTLHAFERGDQVVSRAVIRLVRDGNTVDEVAPGQVLTVLNTRAEKLWVSRGLPGWVEADEVMALGESEAYFAEKIQQAPSAEWYLARGTVRIASGDHQKGISDLSLAVASAKNPSEFLEPLGFGYLGANDQAAAIKTFDRVLRKTPNSTPALMGRGLALYQAGQLSRAQQDLERAHGLEPDHAFPNKYLGALYHDLGQLDQAAKHLDAAVESDSHDVFSRKARGRLRFERKDYEGAMQDFRAATLIAPSDVEAVTGRGVVQHAIGNDLAAAEQDFQRVVEAAEGLPEDAYCWSNLGQVQLELGKYALAFSNLSRAIELDPEFNEARSLRALLHASHQAKELFDPERSKADLRLVFQSSDERTYWDYHALAEFNAAIGDWTRAAKYQDAAVKLIERSGPVRFVDPAKRRWKEFDDR